jgi:hypothetical protein
MYKKVVLGAAVLAVLLLTAYSDSTQHVMLDTLSFQWRGIIGAGIFGIIALVTMVAYISSKNTDTLEEKEQNDVMHAPSIMNESDIEDLENTTEDSNSTPAKHTQVENLSQLPTLGMRSVFVSVPVDQRQIPLPPFNPMYQQIQVAQFPDGNLYDIRIGTHLQQK